MERAFEVRHVSLAATLLNIFGASARARQFVPGNPLLASATPNRDSVAAPLRPLHRIISSDVRASARCTLRKQMPSRCIQRNVEAAL